MYEGRKLYRTIITILTIICFCVTAIVGFFYISYRVEVDRLLGVGLILKTQHLHDVSVKQMLTGAVRGMVESLDDPYSVFMDKKEFDDLQNYIQGSIGGIGIYVGVKEKKLVVVSTIDGTPASKAGILRDDVIVKVGDFFTSEMEYDESIAKMRGEPGTTVTISLMRAGEPQLLEFTLTRENIDIPSLESEVLADNIGYLRLIVFASNTDEAVAEELQKLTGQGIKALVLDLRDNPGGDLETAVNIAKQFVPKGPIVHIVDKGGRTQEVSSADDDYLKLPLVVLINGGSASASEVLSGAIKDTKSGVLMGEKTFGKGIVQGIFPLGGGEGLKLTTSKYLTPNKTDIHEKGIEPDVLIEQPVQDKTAKDSEDIQLKKAVEYLQVQLK